MTNAARYFDYAASAPLDPRVREAVLEALDQTGNPSSIHEFGRLARARLDDARQQVARLLEVTAGEIFFTSGASESNNLALRGVIAAARQDYPNQPLRIVASPIEHASIAETLRELAERESVEVVYLPVDRLGRVNVADVVKLIDDKTILVSVQWANNILGTVQPLPDIGQVVEQARARRGAASLPIYLMSDAVQAVNCLPVRPKSHGIDLLTLSGHKLGGPLGAGALFVRRGTHLTAQLTGGGQESHWRSGTQNMSGAVGLGLAAQLAREERAARVTAAEAIGAKLRVGLAGLAQWEILSPTTEVLPNILFARHARLPGDELVIKLDAAGFAVAAGSACDAGKRQGSGAIAAIFGEQAALRGGVRLSWGRDTTFAEAAELLVAMGKM